MTNKYLTKSSVLNADDRVYEDVDVPEWGGVVRVQSLMATEKDAFEASITSVQRIGRRVVQKPDFVNVRAKLAVLCMVDEAGQRLFSDGDVAELGRKSAAALDRVIEVAKRLSRLNDADLEELTAGLKNAPPAASATA